MTTSRANKPSLQDIFDLDREKQKIKIMKIMLGLFSLVLIISLLLSLLLSH